MQVLVAAQEVVSAEEAEKDQLCVDIKLMVQTKGGGESCTAFSYIYIYIFKSFICSIY